MQFKGGDAEFVSTKLMTRLTYTLDEARGWGDGVCSSRGRALLALTLPIGSLASQCLHCTSSIYFVPA